MQSNSAEDVPNPLLNRRLMQTKCENEIFLLYSSQFHLYCIVVAVTPLLFYLILFFPAREVRWSWPFTSESWGWGAPKSFLLAKQQLQLLFFFSKSLSTSLPSHSKKVLNAMIMKTSILKIDIYTGLTFGGQILAFWTPLTILEPSHLSIWKNGILTKMETISTY